MSARTTADWPLPAASSSAPGLGSGQSACPSGESPSLNLPSQLSNPRGPLHFAYVLKHIAAHAPDGRAWQIAGIDALVALAEHPVDLVVQLRLTPPAGAPLRQFTLTYDVISHEVMNHFALISVRRDWRRGIFSDDPEAVLLRRSYLKTAALDRRGGSLWPGLGRELPRQFSRVPAGAAPLAVLGALAAFGFLFQRRFWRSSCGARGFWLRRRTAA